MLKEFGNNVICTDSTFKTTGYDFTLITILVIDEFGEGYPVAWCLTSREDQELISLFFETIKNKSGMVIPQWKTTDDADQFSIHGKLSLVKIHRNYYVLGMWMEHGEVHSQARL